MPLIKPFKGILPDENHVSEVVLHQIDNLFESLSKQLNNPSNSFLYLVNPPLDERDNNEFESPYRNTLLKLKAFLQQKVLQKDQWESFYVYRVSKGGQVSSGLWTCTLIDDYLNNIIKRHELTQQNKEQQLFDFIEQTGLDSIPVIIAYAENESIENIIEQATSADPFINYTDEENKTHQLWRIHDLAGSRMLKESFLGIKETYIADGHHRISAYARYCLQRRMRNVNHTGYEEYNYFSSIYFNYSNLRLYAYSRLVKTELTIENVLKNLEESFLIEPLINGCYPQKKRDFGLYCEGNWYKLSLLNPITDIDPMALLDVSILQNKILHPIFNILDPRNDSNLGFAPATLSCEELKIRVHKEGFNIALTLFPTSMEEVITVANLGKTMPPKSTWFEPKLPLGLITHFVD